MTFDSVLEEKLQIEKVACADEKNNPKTKPQKSPQSWQLIDA